VPFLARRRLLVVSLSLSLLGSAATSGAASPAPFAPDRAASARGALEGQTWTLEAPDCTLRLRLVGASERLAIIERTTGAPVDPFATPPGAERGFVSFAIEVENRAESTVIFHPERARLVVAHDVDTPLGMQALETAYRLSGRDLPEAYRGAAAAVLEQSRTLAPGEALSGLLVFRAPRPRTRSFVTEVQLTLPSGTVATLAAPYRRVRGAG
jgi:hypothetical protein